MTVPLMYRRLATQCPSRKSIGTVALALYRHQEDLDTPLVEIAREAGVNTAMLSRWTQAAGLPARREMRMRQHVERAGALFDRYGTVDAVASELRIAKSTAKRAIISAGRLPKSRSEAVRESVAPLYEAPDGWATVKDLIQVLGISRAQAVVWCKSGVVPGAKLVPVRPGARRSLWLIPAGWLREQEPRRPVRLVEGRQDRRLPAGPLASWVARQGRDEATLAELSGVPSRRLYAIRSGEQTTVTLWTADRLLTANDARLEDVWPDIDELLAA